MRARSLLGIVFACTVGVFAVAESEARACGGCFSPPPPPPPSPRLPSVVTDHRMILSVGQQQTTLYDELRYDGNPESFAWVLPITGQAKIGVSSDGLFATLDAMTNVVVVPPPVNCPSRPNNCNDGDELSASPGASDSRGSSGGGVTVTAQETVGPYETVQLKSDDPQALNEWLTSHGYTVPDDIKPVIAQYVAEHFDFLALKLVPGTGVQAMRPVRVSTSGASVVLPLRMVAAGTGATVGVTLWTLGEGRYQPQNFPVFEIKANELEWDWTTYTSNMSQLRTERAALFNGRGWELESSVQFTNAEVRSAVTNGYCQPVSYTGGYYGGGGGGPAGGGAAAFPSICSGAQNNYEAEDAGPGNPPRTKEIVQAEDLETLVGSIPGGVRITRVRSSLAHAALDQDLVLSASAEQNVVETQRKVTREKNQPLCPIYSGCQYVGQAPRDEAFAKSGGGSESFSCAVRQGSGNTGRNAAITIGGFAALAMLIAKRLKNRRGD